MKKKALFVTVLFVIMSIAWTCGGAPDEIIVQGEVPTSAAAPTAGESAPDPASVALTQQSFDAAVAAALSGTQAAVQTAQAPAATDVPVVATSAPIIDASVFVPPALPADNWAWLAGEKFEAPLCDPHSFVWFDPLDDDEGFKPTGGHEDKYDIVLHVNAQGLAERAIAYGTDVTIDGTNYGRSLVFFEAPGRYAVSITDGAYRAGHDYMGLYPEYYAQVLRCLYGGDWPVKQHQQPAPVSTSVATP